MINLPIKSKIHVTVTKIIKGKYGSRQTLYLLLNTTNEIFTGRESFCDANENFLRNIKNVLLNR